MSRGAKEGRERTGNKKGREGVSGGRGRGGGGGQRHREEGEGEWERARELKMMELYCTRIAFYARAGYVVIVVPDDKATPSTAKRHK